MESNEHGEKRNVERGRGSGVVTVRAEPRDSHVDHQPGIRMATAEDMTLDMLYQEAGRFMLPSSFCLRRSL